MNGPNGGYMGLLLITKLTIESKGTILTFIDGLPNIFRYLCVVTFDCCYVQACHHRT